MLSCAPPSEWGLSIYRGCGEGGHYDKKHTLESLKTGVECDWSNVGFHVLDQEECGVGYKWQWTDEQFAFDDKFMKACRKQDFYIAVPYIDEFDGELVKVAFRTRYGLNDKKTQIPPFEWRKISLKKLGEVLAAWEMKHKDAHE